MRKTCFLWVILLALLTQSIAFAAQDVPASGPENGLYGFSVLETGVEKIVDAPTITYVHDKTGALVHCIMTEDVEGTFTISFKTPAINDKGLPHVLEHISVSGSEKYPSPNLFFPLATQTYNTFINAFTYENMTTYPVASLSEDQLLVLADYYLSGVFEPLVYSEERLFQREAWRYSLSDADAPLELTGTVLSEMRGTQSIYETANYALMDALYPGSIRANNSGGDPDHIPEITWDELKTYHTTYYHPSNSLTTLYGDLDHARFLELLDGYFSAFERKEITIDDGSVPPQSELVTRTALHPAEADTPAENTAHVQYAFVANGADLSESIALKILGDVLCYDTSPLVRNVRDTFPNAVVYTNCAVGIENPSFTFTVEGVDETDAARVKEIIDESLAEIIESGFDASTVEAVHARGEMFTRLAPNMPDSALGISTKIAEMWAGRNTLSYYNGYLDVFESMDVDTTKGHFEELLRRYVLENNHAALLTTVPAPGMTAEKEMALAAHLQKEKDAMTVEAVNALVENSRALEAWSQEEPSDALLSSLQAVSVDTLPEEAKAHDIMDTTQDGVRLMTASANVSGVNSVSAIIDTAHVPQELLHYMKLYTLMIGTADTPSHDAATLETVISKNLYGFGAYTTTFRHVDGSFRPALNLYWLGTDDKLAESLELVHEMAFETSLEDVDRLRMVISREQLMQRAYVGEGNTFMQEARALGIVDAEYAYQNELAGLPYYDFIMQADALLADDPDGFIGKLKEVRQLLRNGHGMVIRYAGNKDGTDLFQQEAHALYDGLNMEEKAQASYAFAPASNNEATVADTAVQYNLLCDTLENLGLAYSGKLDVLTQIIGDRYLTPQIRQVIGAYGVFFHIDRAKLSISSYRDPSIGQTFDVYSGLADFAATAELSQEEIDRYIMQSYASLALSQGKLYDAEDAMTAIYTGLPADEKLERMRAAKSVTLDDLRALAPVFEKLDAQGIRSTIGGETIIEQNSDRFDEILHPAKEQ